MTGSAADAAPAGGRRDAKRRAGGAADRGLGPAKGVSRKSGETGRGHFGRFTRRAGNYRKTILWSVHDTFAQTPRKLFIALVFGWAALGAQVLAILIVFGYGQALQRDGGLAIPFLGIDWSARTDTAMLVATAGGFAASLAAAAVLGFISNGLLLAMVRRSLARAVDRMARAAALLPDPRAPKASVLLADFTLRGLSTAATGSARSAFLIVKTLPALAGAAIAAIVLFWQAPALTAILLAIATIWSALLYPVSLRAVAFGKRLRRASAAIRSGQQGLPTMGRWAPAEELAAAYSGWLRTGAIIALVVGIGIAAIVAIALATIGSELINGTRDWPMLIAYVGALQVALNGAFRTIRAVAFVSRRYPEMVRHRHFVLDLRGLEGPTAALRKGDAIDLGAGEPVFASAGERLAVVWDEAIGKVQLLALHARNSSGIPVASARASWAAPEPTRADAPILFAEARLVASNAGNHRTLPAWDGLLIVVHSTRSTVGSLGESRLLVVDENRSEIVRSVALGSEEAEAVLARAAKRAARKGKRKLTPSDPDEDLE